MKALSNGKEDPTEPVEGSLVNLGDVVFTQGGNREAYVEILSKLDLKPPVLIKPNWSDSVVFTEKEVLDWTLSAIDGEAIVVESYAFYRTKILAEYGGRFDSEIEQKLVKQKKSDFSDNDRWFLEYSGIGEILDRHGTEYLNISEEVWADRVCDPESVRRAVRSRFDPVDNDILYSLVPSKLYDLRGGTLLSLAKPKIAFKKVGVSLSLKNMFGMIPGPFRGKFHGAGDSRLNQSIVDINKVYRALFDVRGVIEALFSTFQSRRGMSPFIHKDMGLIWGSNDTLEMDALIAAQLGRDPDSIEYLSLAAESFGPWNPQTTQIGRQNPIDFG